MGGTGKVGRALRCPPSGIGRGTNVTLLSCGGQGTARPTTMTESLHFVALLENRSAVNVLEITTTQRRIRNMTNRRFSTLACAIFFAGTALTYGQTSEVGLFAGHSDVGKPGKPGSVQFDAARGAYIITGRRREYVGHQRRLLLCVEADVRQRLPRRQHPLGQHQRQLPISTAKPLSSSASRWTPTRLTWTPWCMATV